MFNKWMVSCALLITTLLTQVACVQQADQPTSAESTVGLEDESVSATLEIPGCEPEAVDRFSQALDEYNPPKALAILEEECEQTAAVHLQAAHLSARIGSRYGFIRHAEAVFANPAGIDKAEVIMLKLYAASAYATVQSDPNLERARQLIEDYHAVMPEDLYGIDTYLYIAHQQGDLNTAITLCDLAFSVSGDTTYLEKKEGFQQELTQ